jgi:hypothetical protein
MITSHQILWSFFSVCYNIMKFLCKQQPFFNLLTVRPLYSESQRQSSRQRLGEDLQQAMDEIHQPKISDLGHIRLLWGRELSARFVAWKTLKSIKGF